MKAVVFRAVGDIRLEDVDEPRLKDPGDAIVRITASAICGTDLHMVRGTLPGMKPGTVLGHEGVGVVEEVGEGVRNFVRGDRVVLCSTIACGSCAYCRAGYHAQCDRANPNGRDAGTAFYGGPAESGSFDGMQAELVRVPFANVGMVKLPDEIGDDDAILLSDIFPTGWFGARMAEIEPGDTVAVFGCGPVGQFVIASAILMQAGRIFAVDAVDSRLEMARAQGAEIVHFEKEDPVAAIKELTGGIGVDRVVDAVGVDASRPHHGPAEKQAAAKKKEFERELDEIAPKTRPHGDHWHPGDAPSLALTWAMMSLAKAGTLSVVGVYPQAARSFPIGMAMNRNITMKGGNCHHRRYVPKLIELVRTGAIHPSRILTQRRPLTSAIEAYEAFDLRAPGWTKVELRPAA